MAKPEIEISSIDHVPWQPIPGFEAGVTERVLALDPETGSKTRLLKLEPGSETPHTMYHDFWEEVWILEGSLTDMVKNLTFTKGMYGCRPPGMPHGPFHTDEGCITFEVITYPPK